jgi:hypothetical protein
MNINYMEVHYMNIYVIWLSQGRIRVKTLAPRTMGFFGVNIETLAHTLGDESPLGVDTVEKVTA